ncbi:MULTISPECIES: AAA family ATPase [Clostridium]|uniref:AAA family ATPase n=1 Tax=Clostridium TaxID=1485 RepID=UPI0003F806CD|nr:AAA family ATPase [Clostridium cadaveris]MDU4953522.1 hypothetical protein [Clostridium sp.]
MSMPGIGDPYWYEWYVGLENIIDMLNEDNEIEYVVFQKDLYETIDDVVVGYKNRMEYCYQVKHEIGSGKRYNLTFDKLITGKQSGKDKKMSLIQALACGWKNASEVENKNIVPVLYTNRTLGKNKTNRTYNGNKYKALSLESFAIKMQEKLKEAGSIRNINFDDKDLNFQYQEFYNAIDLDDETITRFLKVIEIKSQMYSLEEIENLMISKLQTYFRCTSELANTLFRNLTSQLRIWTTTRRNDEKVTIEDVYNALALKQEYENTSQHQLVAPSPFFDSRKKFVDEISKLIYNSDKKVVFLSGEPGCGKTSIISYMQNNYDCFIARYHTFRPISPEQRFYDLDEGLCLKEVLWGELMNQLRTKLRGQLMKYRVPVNNALCGVSYLRSEVLRILEQIYTSKGEKVYVCIDGIDHAARSKISVNFLTSLFQPDEIPEGVCFVIVGQPEEMYQNYPLWLNKENKEILYIKIPHLSVDDIKQLLENKITSSGFQNDGLTRAIFDKTQGNNLSVVFAVEEIKKSENINQALKVLDLSHVSGDIEQYYTHIWNYLKSKIREFGLSINFPDITIASAILLLNGRIRVDLLEEAFKDINLNSDDWRYIFDCLYPLIERSEKDNTYFVFHNDFRVFLMGVIKKNKTKYKELSYKMAMYFINDADDKLEKYVNVIPLLNCAGKASLIPNVFSTKFVIGALANGVSRKMLGDYARQAYQNVCKNKNWNEFHTVYLAISTLKQHYSYFEYYDMQYIMKDISNIQQIQSFEIINKEFCNDNLDEFNEVLEFINRLIKYGGDKYYDRIATTYNLWFGNITPLQTIKKLLYEVKVVNAVWRTNEIIKFMQNWGNASAFLDKYQYLPEKIPEDEGANELLEFNDAFFDYYFYEKDYQKANDLVKKFNITCKCVENKIFKMMEDCTVNLYIKLIQTIASSNRNDVLNRLSKVLCMIHGENKYDIKDISSYSDITYISDDTTLEIIVDSILEGIRDQRNDIVIICSHVFNKMKIEEKDYNKNDINYLRMMIRVCVVIGKHIVTKTSLNEGEKIIVKAFIKANARRTFDFSKAYKTIIYCLCNHQVIDASFANNELSNLVKEALFKYANIGQYCKTIFLNYLWRKKHFEIIKEYIMELYGKNGVNLFSHDQYTELFYHYYDYAKEVVPDLCDEIEKKIKWNVVGYTGHKEYALDGPQIILKELLKNNPELWEKEGIQLYNLSNIADIASGNRVSGRIEDTINEAAIRRGAKDFWKWHNYDSEIAYSLHTLYSQIFYMITQVTNASQLLDIWLYSCGIQSWYRQDDRIGIKSVYSECRKKAEEIKYTLFESDCKEYTPSYLEICLHEGVESKYTSSNDDFNKRWEMESEKAIMEINELPTEALVNCIIYQNEDSHSWKRINRALERLQENKLLSEEIANKILEEIIVKLSQYTWEHHGCTYILKQLIDFLGENASWALAESILPYLDEYQYYTSTSNMFFILKRNFNKFNLQDMFTEEYNSQYAWVSGNNHINLKNTCKKIEEFRINPSDITETLFIILLENLNLGNIHRMEIALPAIYNMSKKCPKLFLIIVGTWKDLSDHAQNALMLCSVRWARERREGFQNLVNLLKDEYEQSNILSIKYILHTILDLYEKSLNVNENCELDITFNADNAESSEYRNSLSVLHKNEVEVSTRFFLDLVSHFEDVNDLYKRMPLFDAKTDCKYSIYNRDGDSICISNIKRNISQQILYGEEQKGRWNYIPLNIKKQWLLTIDDAYLMTSTPSFSYDDYWNIEGVLSKMKDENKRTEIEKTLQKICIENNNENEIVIGSVIWYPLGGNGSLIYTIVAKILSNTELFANNNIYQIFMNYSIICDEDKYFELGNESEYDGGISLVKTAAGSSIWYYNNPMVYPANIIIQELRLFPDFKNPYIWYNNDGKVVLRYERMAHPTRNITQQYYIRQPILGRWLCNKQILKEWMSKNMLQMKYVDKLREEVNI